MGLVCGEDDRQERGVCAGREAAISKQKINNSTPHCLSTTLNA